MRKWFIVLTVAVLVMVGIVPALAQSQTSTPTPTAVPGNTATPSTPAAGATTTATTGAVTTVTTTAVPTTTGTPRPVNTIVDIASRDGRFDTLVSALTAAGLTNTLNGTGPFTVFAPTDAAFAALGDAAINNLLANTAAGGPLNQTLLYHVLPGSFPAASVSTLTSATTVQGSPIRIEVVNGGVVLDRTVNIIATDIQASNGIIHVIDAVLQPPTAVREDAALVQIVNATPVQFSSLGGDSNSILPAQQTFLVSQFANGAYKLRDIPGWVRVSDVVTVPRNFGLPASLGGVGS